MPRAAGHSDNAPKGFSERLARAVRRGGPSKKAPSGKTVNGRKLTKASHPSSPTVIKSLAVSSKLPVPTFSVALAGPRTYKAIVKTTVTSGPRARGRSYLVVLGGKMIDTRCAAFSAIACPSSLPSSSPLSYLPSSPSPSLSLTSSSSLVSSTSSATVDSTVAAEEVRPADKTLQDFFDEAKSVFDLVAAKCGRSSSAVSFFSSPFSPTPSRPHLVCPLPSMTQKLASAQAVPLDAFAQDLMDDGRRIIEKIRSQSQKTQLEVPIRRFDVCTLPARKVRRRRRPARRVRRKLPTIVEEKEEEE